MRLEFKKIMLLVLMASITGMGIICCISSSPSEYEDPDMTKAFLEKNKKKMEEVYSLENRNKEVRRANYYKVDFYQRITFYESCSDYRISLTRDELVFDIKDIRELGKERMFQEAQKCLNIVVKDIKAKDKDREKEEAYKKIGIENEQKKFDISKVNN